MRRILGRGEVSRWGNGGGRDGGTLRMDWRGGWHWGVCLEMERRGVE